MKPALAFWLQAAGWLLLYCGVVACILALVSANARDEAHTRPRRP